MRPDDDLWFVARDRLGSARVSRAGFGVAPKRTFLVVFILLSPDPGIILVLSSYGCVQWISRDVMKFFFQIAIGSDVAIKSFLFPYRAAFAFDFVNLMR